MLKITGHIALSLMLLISASGMTINMHFCQGHLYDLALNSPAHDCCENGEHVNTCHHIHDIAKPHHCDDESIKIESQQVFVTSGYNFNFEDSHSFEIPGFSGLIPEYPVAKNNSANRIPNYEKPPPQEVILSQIQAFLI